MLGGATLGGVLLRNDIGWCDVIEGVVTSRLVFIEEGGMDLLLLDVEDGGSEAFGRL